MRRRERIRLVLERMTALLWVTLLLLLGVRAALDGHSSYQSTNRPGSALCSLDAGLQPPCSRSLEGLTLRLPDPTTEAWFLAVPTGLHSCTRATGPFPGLRREDATAALARLRHDCGLLPPTAAAPGPADCRAAAEAPTTLQRVKTAALSPCLTPVAGPFDRHGELVPGRVEHPFLTLFPAATITPGLLNVFALRQRLSPTFTPLQNLQGSAFGGWLVLPVAELPRDAESRTSALYLLTRVAAAIGGTPRPTPALADLGRLTTCPRREELADLVQELEKIGYRSFGHRGLRPLPEPTGVQLAHGGDPYAVLYSLRVGAQETACSTLPWLPLAHVAQELAPYLATEVPSGALAVVFVHAQLPLDNAQVDLLTAQLADAGADVAVINHLVEPAMGTTRFLGDTLALAEPGRLLAGNDLLPGDPLGAGVVLRCYRTGDRAASCALNPMTHTLGDALPVAGSDCPACALLPHTLRPLPAAP